MTYHVPRYRFRACRTFTNKPACDPSAATARRERGSPRKCSSTRSPWTSAWTRRTCAQADRARQFGHRELDAHRDIGLAECIKAVVDGSGWRRRRGKLGFGRGLGLACSSYLSGAGLPIYWNEMPHSGVQLQLDRSGRVTAFCGATEIGQGSDDVLAAIIAEVLGIGAEDVRLVTGDTDLTPVDLGSYSSARHTDDGQCGDPGRRTNEGGHRRGGGGEARGPRPRASASPTAGSSMSRRRRWGWTSPTRPSPLKRCTAPSARPAATRPEVPGQVSRRGRRPERDLQLQRGGGRGAGRSGHGWITVPKVWIGHDIGRVITRCGARQVEGGVYMGLGEALMERWSTGGCPTSSRVPWSTRFPACWSTSRRRRSKCPRW